MSASPANTPAPATDPSAEDPLAPTLIPASPPSDSNRSAGQLPSKAIQFFVPSGAGFQEETRRLLHYRLLVVHASGSVVMAVLVAMCLIGDPVLGAESGLGRKSFWFPLIVLVDCLAVGVYLLRRKDISLETLRLFELALFFLLALVGSVVKLTALTVPHQTFADDPRYADVLLRYGGVVTNTPFIFAILIYGVLIPNERRRSLGVVAGLCLLPLTVTVLAATMNPTLRASLDVVLPLTALSFFMSGVIAVVSADRSQTLRQEVYDARREAKQVGHYSLKKKLGEGGMGEVYLAEHKLLKRPCAIKFIRADLAANQSNALRFEREVRAMTTLSHFNTVRVYDYGRADDGSFYYVMEYLEGLTLDSLIRTHGPLSPARAVHLIRQVCGALAEAHAAGLIHRDLKPGNILVAAVGGQYDVAKLLDFGLVQNLGSLDSDPRLTQTGTVLGTPAYMCPEQAGGEAVVDARGDVYSLGAVLFYCLARRPPFEGQSVGKLLAAHLTERPPFLSTLNAAIPEDLARQVDRCLAKDPKERFQTIREMEHALALCACANNWTLAQAQAWWADVGKPANTVKQVPDVTTEKMGKGTS